MRQRERSVKGWTAMGRKVGDREGERERRGGRGGGGREGEGE